MSVHDSCVLMVLLFAVIIVLNMCIDWSVIIKKLLELGEEDFCTMSQVLRALPPKVRERQKQTAVELVQILQSRLFLAQVDGRGSFLILGDEEDLVEEALVMLHSPLPQDLLSQWNAYSKLARIVCLEGIGELANTNITLKMAKDTRAELSPHVTSFLQLLEDCHGLDSQGYLSLGSAGKWPEKVEVGEDEEEKDEQEKDAKEKEKAEKEKAALNKKALVRRTAVVLSMVKLAMLNAKASFKSTGIAAGADLGLLDSPVVDSPPAEMAAGPEASLVPFLDDQVDTMLISTVVASNTVAPVVPFLANSVAPLSSADVQYVSTSMSSRSALDLQVAAYPPFNDTEMKNILRSSEWLRDTEIVPYTMEFGRIFGNKIQSCYLQVLGNIFTPFDELVGGGESPQLFQIFESGNHWICTCYIRGVVWITDSYIKLGAWSQPDFLRQLVCVWVPSRVSVREKCLKLSLAKVQQQDGANDCGAFALMFAYLACIGVDPRAAILHQPTLRKQFLDKYVSKSFRDFEYRVRNGPFEEPRTMDIPYKCRCSGKDFVAPPYQYCDRCKCAVHLACYRFDLELHRCESECVLAKFP